MIDTELLGILKKDRLKLFTRSKLGISSDGMVAASPKSGTIGCRLTTRVRKQ